jgi:hypothetical protein
MMYDNVIWGYGLWAMGNRLLSISFLGIPFGPVTGCALRVSRFAY